MKNDYEIRGDVTAIFLDRRDGTQFETIIDTADLPLIEAMPRKWTSRVNRRGRIYIHTVRDRQAEKQLGKPVDRPYLHRYLMDCPPDMEVDHINGDTLDNRRSNLRIVTHWQNSQNRKSPHRNNRHGMLCVRRSKSSTKPWDANLVVRGISVKVGSFKDPKSAENAAKLTRALHLDHSKEHRLFMDGKQFEWNRDGTQIFIGINGVEIKREGQTLTLPLDSFVSFSELVWDAFHPFKVEINHQWVSGS